MESGGVRQERIAPERRRATILDAAVDLFEERGFNATTTAEIACAAGITKRTLYRYMGSKEQILFEIHERFLDRALAEALTTRSGSSVEQFAAVVRRHVNVVARYQKEIRVTFEEMKHLSSQRRDKLVQRRDEYESIVREVLESGVRHRSFDVPDVVVATKAILGALNDMYRWYRPAQEFEPDEIADLIIRLFSEGLTTDRSLSDECDVAVRLPDVRALEEIVSEPMAGIMRAVTDLFSRKGYHGTTTRELAEKLNLTKGALYYHIGHKGDVLFRTHQLVTEEGIRILSQLSNEDLPTPHVLTRMIVSHARVMHVHRAAIAVFLDEMRHLSPDYMSRIVERRDAYTALLEGIIAQGQRLEEFRPLDPHLVTLVLLGMLNSMYRWYRPDGPLPAEQIGAIMTRLLFCGVLRRT